MQSEENILGGEGRQEAGTSLLPPGGEVPMSAGLSRQQSQMTTGR